MLNPKILVFIPMYNCEKQIPRVLANFDQETQRLFSEILVIDNGSKDRSQDSAKQALEKLTNIKTTLVQNSENYSLGGSHKVAFNYALANGFDYCVVLHGDDQGSILDLVPYIKSGEYQAYDSFLGSRFHKDSKLVHYPALRKWGNIALNLLCSIITSNWVSDMGSGLNLYSTQYLKSKFYLYFPNNLTFNVFLLFYGCYAKSKFKFFPLTWKEEDQISNAKVFQQGFRILYLLLEYLFMRKQLFSGAENEWSRINYGYKVIYSN
jgi:glycosyltransferase involved in cell wall biosynthesis